MAQSHIENLAKELDRIGYYALFASPDSQPRIEVLWNQQGAERWLQLALDRAQPWSTRFLAAEMIFHQQMFLFQPEHFASLAPVYGKALKENASGFMADWGFQHDMNDTGRLGSRFILFGQDSIAVLRPLLDDSGAVAYIYPPEFPSQIRVGFRIQDFAALYLSRICGHPIHLTEDPGQRDGEIRRLRPLV
jgi:hypothetical protein